MQEKETKDVVIEETTTEEQETTKTKEVEQEQVETTTDPTLPTTEDELNKLLQSTGSKAKGEILKELGFKSVKEIKEAIQRGSNVDELTAQIETLTIERDTTKVENDTLKADIQSREDKKLLADNGIPEESAELFLDLVKSNAQEGESRQETAERVREQLIKLTGVDVKIGTGKTKEPVLTEKEEQARLRRL